MLLICVIRNRVSYIPGFLRHYREFGVNDFLFIDNMSTDGTYELLKDEGCTVEQESRAYITSHGCADWVSERLDKIANNTWCLVVDSDELFIYPFMCDSLIANQLPDFCKLLDDMGYQGCFAPLVDMYANDNILHLVPTDNWFNDCPWYDNFHGYSVGQNDKLFPSCIITGGVRSRVFYNCIGGPWLQAVPLIKWSHGMRYNYGRHSLSFPVRLYPYGALLHFKFYQDIYRVTVDAVINKQYSNKSAEYTKYWNILQRGGLNLYREECSCLYSGHIQLLLELSTSLGQWAVIKHGKVR